MKSLLFSCIFITLWKSITAQYTAAVVEYSSFRVTSYAKTIELNLNEYIHYIETARRSNVDIIVFPEYGLSGLYDDDSESIHYALEIPNTNYGTKYENHCLQRLSDASKANSMYVVVNLLEKTIDSSDNIVIYNVNIVFDRKGHLIKKYRKINLIDEGGITPGNETATFSTDFGEIFGFLTCFDILFDHPSQTVLQNKSVTNIIFPTAWMGTFPYYHSLSTQLGYVQANKVNLLAACSNFPKTSTSGSGIYRKDGTVESYYLSGQASSKMLISTIPKHHTSSDSTAKNPSITDSSKNLDQISKPVQVPNFEGKYVLEEADKYKTKILNLSNEIISETLCDGDFCCHLNITTKRAEVNVSEIYKLVVYNGPSNVIRITPRLLLCTILACEANDIQTCGKKNTTSTSKFRKISINAEFKTGDGHIYQPYSYKKNMLPVFNSTFISTKSKESVAVSYFTQQTEENLLAFGVTSRLRSRATIVYNSFTGILVISIITHLF